VKSHGVDRVPRAHRTSREASRRSHCTEVPYPKRILFPLHGGFIPLILLALLGYSVRPRTRVGRRLPREYVPSPVGVGGPDFNRPVVRHRQGGITFLPATGVGRVLPSSGFPTCPVLSGFVGIPGGDVGAGLSGSGRRLMRPGTGRSGVPQGEYPTSPSKRLRDVVPEYAGWMWGFVDGPVVSRNSRAHRAGPFPGHSDVFRGRGWDGGGR